MFTIADAIEAFGYPDIQFSYVQLAGREWTDDVVLIASCVYPCTRKIGEDFKVTRAKIVRWGGYQSLAESTRSLRDLVLYLEAHEADERIQVNGERIYDPHSYEDTGTP